MRQLEQLSDVLGYTPPKIGRFILPLDDWLWSQDPLEDEDLKFLKKGKKIYIPKEKKP